MITYSKLADDTFCKFPEREECNYNDKVSRCPHMKYDNSKTIFDSSRWFCDLKINKKKIVI